MKAFSKLLAAVVALPLLLGACEQKAQEASSEAKAEPAAEKALRQAVTVDGSGFHPEKVTAAAGQNVTLVFRRVTDATCAKQVVFKDLGIRKDLPLNEDVEVTVTAKSPALTFACGMDMLRGSVVVGQ